MDMIIDWEDMQMNIDRVCYGYEHRLRGYGHEHRLGGYGHDHILGCYADEHRLGYYHTNKQWI